MRIIVLVIVLALLLEARAAYERAHTVDAVGTPVNRIAGGGGDKGQPHSKSPPPHCYASLFRTSCRTSRAVRK